jgi:sulfide dehydrogenase cytochrome subunit
LKVGDAVPALAVYCTESDSVQQEENRMNTSRAVTALCAAALGAGLALPAVAQDAAHSRSLAATCFTCHGTDGHSVGGVPPSLAGQSKAYLVQAMKDFQSGKRPATVMHQQAKGYTDAQLDAIAGYFAGIKPGSGVAAPAAGN